MKRVFLSAPDISGRERQLVAEAFDQNFIAPAGPMLDRFERIVSDYTGIQHSVAVSSGTASLHLALISAGVRKGDEVWTTSTNFIGGVSPITYLGAEPVFFDIDRASWTIDCDLIAEELEVARRNNRLPKAIVPTDLYGQSSNLQRLIDLGVQYGVKIISDSAEGLGAFRDGKHAGKGAFATIISFNGNKIITTSGGGMLLSDDRKIIEYARKLATQARENFPHYEHTEIGFNYRMSNVSAAIGIGQMEGLEKKIARRRGIFENYRSSLGTIPGIGFMPEPEGCRSTRWLTCITFERSELSSTITEVLEACEKSEIEVRPLWKPMHMQPVFKGSRFVGEGYCTKLFDCGLCLPSGSGMPDDDQQRVIDVLAGLLE